MVSGRPTDMALLESIAVQVRKMGAFPLVSVSTDQMARRMFDEVPTEFDNQTDDFGLKLAGIVDATIMVESMENPALFAGSSPARMAARAKSGLPILETTLRRTVHTHA
jgi:aminopeptidase